MKKAALLLLFTSFLPFSYGQPSPCRDENLDIVENVKKIDFNRTDFTFVDLQLKNDSNYYRWKDVLQRDSIVTNKLILVPSSYKYCSNIKYKSNRNERFYSTGNTPNDILIIQSGMQKMYIVFPHSDRIENEYFFGTITDSIHKLNIQTGKRSYYNPNRYISNIEFREGIFFIENYDEIFKTRSFKRSDVSEFFPESNVIDVRDPKEYWNEEVFFLSLFSNEKELEYSKVILGYFKENQVIEIILKKHSKLIRSILESSTDEIVFKKNRTDRQELFFKIWNESLRKNSLDKERELLQKIKAGEISIKEAYLLNKEFKKSEFFSILESDYDLMRSYYDYFLNEKSDLEPFQEFIYKNNLKFNKNKLSRFIKKYER